jgi:carboxylate-amine ligase
MTRTALTVGVEEEFLLLDPISGRPASGRPDLAKAARRQAGRAVGLMRFQFEIATGVCTDLRELHDDLLRLLRPAAAGARRWAVA